VPEWSNLQKLKDVVFIETGPEKDGKEEKGKSDRGETNKLRREV